MRLLLFLLLLLLFYFYIDLMHLEPVFIYKLKVFFILLNVNYSISYLLFCIIKYKGKLENRLHIKLQLFLIDFMYT